jgi:hypothetical protein
MDEYRSKYIEVMARANHQAFDELSERQKTRLRETAGRYLDSLRGIAYIMPVKEDEVARVLLGVMSCAKMYLDKQDHFRREVLRAAINKARNLFLEEPDPPR